MLNELTQATLEHAARIIRRGGVVIAPTETFYGLAAYPFNVDAVRRIFHIKRRPPDKPLPLIAADLAAVERVASLSEPALKRLVSSFWPGSLTILLKPLVPFSPLLTGAGGMVGIRVPPPCPARELAARVGGLITATSANLSGDPNPDRVEEISPPVIAAVDLVLDLGRTPGGRPSTVVTLAGGNLRIVREGAIAPAAIEAVVGRD